MATSSPVTRPDFAAAVNAWKALLNERRLPSDLLWIFDENLCFEKSPDQQEFKVGFQTRFTPPPPEAEQIAYDYFCDFDSPIVFYRMGSARGKSVCLLLCDEWFQAKGESQGFVRRDEWRISFHPGAAGELTEIVDEQRWQQRIRRERPLHDLDFCMTLRAVHEILAHGRVLTAYEHYALRFLHAWRRLLGEKA